VWGVYGAQVVDLQCLWDAEAEFVRFGRGLLPKNNG